MSTPDPKTHKTLTSTSTSTSKPIISGGALSGTLPGIALILASVLPAALSPSTPPSVAPTEISAVATPTTGGNTARPRIFFGSLHSHTSYSDGLGTPTDAFIRARDVGKMDFIAVTEHNHKDADGSGERKDGILIATQPGLYNGTDPASLLSAARTLTVDDRFVAIAGQEFSTISSGNHTNVFDVGEVIDVANGDYASLYDTWLPQHPDSLGETPLAQFNHPDFKADTVNASTKAKERENDYGFDDYNKDFAELLRHAEKSVRLIEMVSGPALTKLGSDLPIKTGNRHEKDYWFYLNRGFRLAPTANQDNHFLNWGTITRARTAVLANRLTKADILRALKARNVYASEDDNLQVRFLVNGQQMGSVIRTPQPQDLTIDVEIADPDEPTAQYKIELYRDEVGGEMIDGAVDETELEGDGMVSFAGQRFESGVVFFFVKVFQDGSNGREELVWTAPVWIEFGQPLPPPSPTPTPIPGVAPSPAQTFVHSRNSQIYHFANCADIARIKPENRVEANVEPEDKTLHKTCPRVRN
jgi:hypothetical protein